MLDIIAHPNEIGSLHMTSRIRTGWRPSGVSLGHRAGELAYLQLLPPAPGTSMPNTLAFRIHRLGQLTGLGNGADVLSGGSEMIWRTPQTDTGSFK
jgi:hypothetical protein